MIEYAREKEHHNVLKHEEKYQNQIYFYNHMKWILLMPAIIIKDLGISMYTIKE